MKNTIKKLSLSRQTLRSLTPGALADVAGGGTLKCVTYAPACNSAVNVCPTEDCFKLPTR